MMGSQSDLVSKGSAQRGSVDLNSWTYMAEERNAVSQMLLWPHGRHNTKHMHIMNESMQF